mmetsp:Transcript_24919/g.18832  ORF Transcript_24919/g.18832 Transcript_24919/m.18832 type:complete len:131 (-) Transcript_24919:21-413(-)
MFDKDGDGTIILKNLKTVVCQLGFNISDEELQDIANEGYCVIDFPDFLSLMPKKVKCPNTREELLKTLKELDREGSGLISASELRYILTNMNEKMSDEEVDELMNQSDVDGDGCVNYEDFYQLMIAKAAH